MATIEEQIQQIEGFQISLEISEPIPHVSFDREAMEQVIHNVMDNAYKYSGDSKAIEVRLFLKGNKVIFSVRDCIYYIISTTRSQEKAVVLGSCDNI